MREPSFLSLMNMPGWIEKIWAHGFREKVLPHIDKDLFAHMYSSDMGRPNRPVQTLLGVLVLKEMFNRTDMEALDQLRWHDLWHHALGIDRTQARVAQKTLHNFRVRLMQHDAAKLAFIDITDRMLRAGGISEGKQRLDSTHITSNFAALTRLGLFCETIRVFIRAAKREHPELTSQISDALAQRYWKDDEEPFRYEDARASDSRRRLGVCARDLYRLVDMFRGTAVAQLKEYGMLERLLSEQCHVGSPGNDGSGTDDGEEEYMPVTLKAPAEVPSSSMQTPHDTDVTYSGYKGKDYEVQLAEICDEDNHVQLITYAEVTPSSGSDATVTVDVLDELAERDIAPAQLLADTAYGSGANEWEAELRGTELLSPVGGRAGPSPGERAEDEKLSAADFGIDPTERRKAVCPAGHRAMGEYQEGDATQRLQIHFRGSHCGPHHLKDVRPVRWRAKPGHGMEYAPFGPYVLSIDMASMNLDRRRAEQTDDEEGWRRTYALRAGPEATNLEMKGRHGLGRIRVRGRGSVRLAVYLKALACNVGRAFKADLAETTRLNPSIDDPDAVPIVA